MALITCPECGKQVSDKANSCPNCGYPLTKKVDTVKSVMPNPANTVNTGNRYNSSNDKSTEKFLGGLFIVGLICAIFFLFKSCVGG